MKNIYSDYKKNKSWGIITNIDLHSCDSNSIRDAKEIEKFVIELCDFIKAKRFGECTVVHFGEKESIQGFSMVQLIETSIVSGHFANATNHAYIDIFSCKYYNPTKAAEFSKKFFKAKDYTLNYIFRK
jgi:S-adenosylmethionine/arginine decarboxylase-like enzyme